MARHIVSMLTAVFFLAVLPFAAEASFPEPEGYVNDFAGVISSEHRQQIAETAQHLKEKGEIELAVVTVQSLEGMPIEQYSIGLAEAWGVGTSREDLGIILLLAVQDRELRLEVGYGLEGDIPDGLAGEILDTWVIPQLRQGNYSSAMQEGARYISVLLADRRGFELAGMQSSYEASGGGADEGDGISGYYFFLLLLLLLGRGRLWPLLFLAGRRRRYSPRGGFGSAPRGGGFGGFGGGGFGGGGASRSF